MRVQHTVESTFDLGLAFMDRLLGARLQVSCAGRGVVPANFALHHEHHCTLDVAAEVDAPLFTSIRIGVAGSGLTRLRFGLSLPHLALRFALH